MSWPGVDQHTIYVIDGSTNTILTTFPYSGSPGNVVVNPTTNRIYVGNWFGNGADVIDGSSNTQIATLPLGIEIGLNPSNNHIYGGIQDAEGQIGILRTIDGNTNTIISDLPLGRGVLPFAIAVNSATGRLYTSEVFYYRDVLVFQDGMGNTAPTVNAGADATVAEGSRFTQAGSFADPDADNWTATVDYGDGAGRQPLALNPDQTFALAHTYADNGLYTVTVTVSDGKGGTASDTLTVAVANVAPTVGTITGPGAPVAVGTAVTITAPYSDPGTGDTHTATLAWGDDTTSAGAATGGTATGTHTYATAGVYTVALTVTDDDRGAATVRYQYVVVYDPNGGFVTGGGWITSPAGAYAADPTLAGRATFGFVSRYKPGATTPTGNTEFQFQAGDLNFKSVSYDWLVVAGARAQYKGTGAINGAGSYKFLLTAIDGQATGGGGTDRFRIKIWDAASGRVVYDNQAGATDDAAPTTTLGGGAIQIQK